MEVAILFLEIFFLSLAYGYMSSEDLKSCVFSGNFEISTLSKGIKKRSENMLFSVVVNIEQLSNLLATLPSKTAIVTSQGISTVNLILPKRRDLLWATMSDFKASSSVAWNFVSLASLPFLRGRNDFCASEVTVGVIRESGICDNLSSKDVFNKTNCYHYQLMGMLAQRLNFTTRAIEIEDKRFPYLYPNGSYSGLFRMVADKIVDVSTGSFVITAKRTLLFDFLWPTFFLDTMLYLKREQNQNPWSSFSKPFEEDVWVAILTYIILSGFIRYILQIFFYNFKESKTGLYNSLLSSLQIFCNQAPEDVPKRFPIRLVHYLSLLSIVVLYPVYSGSIVSFLTVSIPRFPFYNFEGFLADQRYTLMTWRADFLTYYFYFELGDDFIGKNLLTGLDNLPTDVEEGMKRLCHENFIAYADSKQNLADFMDAVQCDVVEVPKRMLVLYIGMIMDENLPCRDRLSTGLRYLHSTGIVKRMQLSLVPELAFEKLQAVKNGYRSITIAEIYPCLVLLTFGVFAAMFIFLIEIYFRKRCYKKRRQRIQLKALERIRCGIRCRPQ